MTEIYSDEYFMNEALKEAEKAFDSEEVPVGCVVVWNNKIIGRGHNLTETLNDATAHAEMQALTAASRFAGKYLKECTLYVTVEPCMMCAGACFWTQIGAVVYGASDEKRGYTVVNGNILHPKTIVKSGILKDKASELMISFFKQKR